MNSLKFALKCQTTMITSSNVQSNIANGCIATYLHLHSPYTSQWDETSPVAEWLACWTQAQ